VPTGSISQVTREAPSRCTSSLQSALKLWTSRRGGSTSRFSPPAMSTTPGTADLYSEPSVQSETVPTPKL
jgi:hypothetical protein